MLRNGNKYILMLVSIIMLTACISQSRTSFIPPQDRESLLAEQPWPHNGFVAISWHNVEDEAADQTFYVSAGHQHCVNNLVAARERLSTGQYCSNS